MGKGTIVSSLGKGLFSLSVDRGAAEKTARIAKIDQQIVAKQNAIDAQQTIINKYQTRLDELIAEQNDLINSYETAAPADKEKAKKDVQQKTGEVHVVQTAIMQAKTKQNLARADKFALETKKRGLEQINTSPQIDAWCIDYTLTASGDVGTIEVPGEPSRVLVKAGARPYVGATDGKRVARALMSPEQVYFNAAVLPGWQMWEPTYRTGIAYNINKSNDTCTVVLDDVRSSAQQLNINRSITLSNVLIRYMDCNSKVFEEGDHVVVKLENKSWNQPKVIGFVSNPKRCRDWDWPPEIFVEIRQITSGAWSGGSFYGGSGSYIEQIGSFPYERETQLITPASCGDIIDNFAVSMSTFNWEIITQFPSEISFTDFILLGLGTIYNSPYAEDLENFDISSMTSGYLVGGNALIVYDANNNLVFTKSDLTFSFEEVNEVCQNETITYKVDSFLETVRITEEEFITYANFPEILQLNRTADLEYPSKPYQLAEIVEFGGVNPPRATVRYVRIGDA